MIKSHKYIYIFICIVFCSLNSVAQKAPHKLDSMKMFVLKNEDYKISRSEFTKRYSYSDTSKAIIDLYFYRRRAAFFNTVFSLPIATALFIADDELCALIKSDDPQKIGKYEGYQTIAFLSTEPLIIAGGIFFFCRGINDYRIYTKKHLLQDLVLYRQQGQMKTRVYQYLESDDLEPAKK